MSHGECVMVGRSSHADCPLGTSCHHASSVIGGVASSATIIALLNATPFQPADQPIICIGSYTGLLQSSFTLRSWWEGALYLMWLSIRPKARDNCMGSKTLSIGRMIILDHLSAEEGATLWGWFPRRRMLLPCPNHAPVLTTKFHTWIIAQIRPVFTQIDKQITNATRILLSVHMYLYMLIPSFSISNLKNFNQNCKWWSLRNDNQSGHWSQYCREE